MARYTGADGAASMPTDPASLAKLKRIVNDGYSMFLRGDSNWSFLDYSHTITTNGDGLGAMNIDGNAARYRMPAFITGNPKGNLVYTDSNALCPFCVVYDYNSVDQHRQVIDTTGTPSMVGFKPYHGREPSGQVIGWEAVFYPTPDSIYTLQGSWRIHPYKMVDPAERHVGGAEHDFALKKAIRYAWALEDEDGDAGVTRHRQAWLDELTASKKIDVPKRPVRRGRLAEIGPKHSQHTPPRALVTHINGMPIPQ